MQAYKKEMAQLAETATTLMENMSDKPSTFTSATHVEHIRAMFKVTVDGVSLRKTVSPGQDFPQHLVARFNFLSLP